MKPLIGRLGIIVTLIFATQSCFAGAKSAEPATITGTIRVVGNEPFTHVVLTPGDHADNAERNRDCLIIGPLAEELRRHYQGQVVALEGMTCASPAPEFTQCFKPTRIVLFRMANELWFWNFSYYMVISCHDPGHGTAQTF